MSKGQTETFNNLPRDASHEPIQVGNSFQTSDATGTPVTSPVSVTSGGVTTLTVPDRAAEVSFFPGIDLRVSEESTVTSYDIVPSEAKEAFPCAGMDFIYLQGDTSNGSVRFKFYIV